MRFVIVLFFLSSRLLLGLGELPWVGVSLKSAEEEQRAAVGLETGVGFRVDRVAKGSPLEVVGGKRGDLWWKFGDQILVNKGQMVVLLRSHEPGDQVEVTFFRQGALQTLKLTLAEQPRHKTMFVQAGPESKKSSRILTKRERVARLSTEGHDLSLRSEGEGWRLEVTKDGTSVLSALAVGNDVGEEIPSKWHQAFSILRISLGDGESQGKERVRYVRSKDDSSQKSN